MDKKYIIAAAAVLMLTACANTDASHDNSAETTLAVTTTAAVSEDEPLDIMSEESDISDESRSEIYSTSIENEDEPTEGAALENGRLRILYSVTDTEGDGADHAFMDEGIVSSEVINIDSSEGGRFFGYEFSGINDGETVICINRYEGATVIGEAYSVAVIDGQIVDYQLTETSGFDLGYIRDVADTSTYTEQAFPKSRLEALFTENDRAVPTEIVVCAKGNAAHTVTVGSYTGHMRNDDSRATVGEPVEISGDINGGRITFKLSEDYFISDYTERMTEMTGGELPDNVNLSGLLICYSNGEDIAEPLATEFNAEARTLTAEIESAGIYLVIDVFAMMDYFGIE